MKSTTGHSGFSRHVCSRKPSANQIRSNADSSERSAQPPSSQQAPVQLIQRSCSCGGACPECQKNKKEQSDLTIQPKLYIGQANDSHELEADRIANHVIGKPTNRLDHGGGKRGSLAAQISTIRSGMNQTTGGVMRRAQGSDRTGGNQASPSLESGIQQSRGRGQPMERATLAEMNQQFGADFSNVRIHTGSQSTRMNRQLGAQAFTVDRDIHFDQGTYNPSTPKGKHLLAHELTHTLQQQGSGLVQRACHDGGCDECEGGIKTLWVTVYFRTPATRSTMTALREKINTAKTILSNCCINLKFHFDWNLLSGTNDFTSGQSRNGADRAANGPWNYPDDAETLGEGNTFKGARGVPLLVVERLDASGLTVTTDFDSQYTGGDYMVLPIEHGKPRSLAHELGHVAGIIPHTAGASLMDRASNDQSVYAAYCTTVRALADSF